MGDARKLKDQAAAARDKGKFKKALSKYLALERLEPHDGAWAGRAAEMYRRLGDNAAAVGALVRATDKYARAGFLVKAIASCKMVLQLEPEHAVIQERLVSLNMQRGLPVTPARLTAISGQQSGASVTYSASRGSGTVSASQRDAASLASPGEATPDASTRKGTVSSPGHPVPLSASPEGSVSSPALPTGGAAPPAPPAAPSRSAAPPIPPARPAAPPVPPSRPASPPVPPARPSAPPGRPAEAPAPPAPPAPPTRTARPAAAPAPPAPPTRTARPAAAPASPAPPTPPTASAPATPPTPHARPSAAPAPPRRRARAPVRWSSPPPPPPPRSPARTPDVVRPAAVESRTAKAPSRGPFADQEPARGAAPGGKPSRRRMRKRPTISPGAPLDAVELNRVVPGSRAETNSEGRITGIFEIPLFAIRDADEADHRADSEGIEIEVVFHDEEEAPDSPSPTRAADALRRTPLLSALGPDSMGVLIEDVELVELSGGETLFREGDAGDCLYVVAEGEVAVIAEGPPRQELARLHDGEFFGEVALVTDEPRSATVTAVTATRLLAIDRAAMSALLAEEPHLLDELLGFLRDRMLDRLLHVNPLFRVLDEPQRVVVGARFRFLEIEAGAELIVQGARARGLFILLSGAAEVVRHQGEGQPDRMLGELRAGDLCGELSLLANAPSVAAVRMTRKTLVIELPADAFREVIMTHPQVLAFVADVADERRRRYDAIIAGTETYDSGRVILW